MTNPDKIRQQKARRLQELSHIARRRYLEVGGNPLHSSNEKYMTEEEKQEFQTLLDQVFDNEYINSYLEKKQKIKPISPQ